MTQSAEQISLINDNLMHFNKLMSTHFDPLVGWSAVSGSDWSTRDGILVVGAETIVA